jgi:DNA-binding NarL/FixJ family response regulator
VVDDNILFQECICELINNTANLLCGETFSSCEEAIRLLEISSAPDVLLLDIELSGKSWINEIRKIKKLSPVTKIIIITALTDDDRIFKAIGAGADGYLLKTNSLDKIPEAIIDVLAGGSPINTQIARKIFAEFASKSRPPKDYGLTDREQEILLLMTHGLTKKAIAEKLFLSHHTIDTHMRNLYDKLHVHKRSSAVSKAIKERIV